MNWRRTRLILWATTAAFAAASILCAVVGLRLPYQCVPPDPKTPSAAPADAAVAAHDKVQSASFDSFANLKLRRPLFDPPPVVAPPPVHKPPPPLALKLAGTVIEPGYAAGLFQFPDGRVEMKCVGEMTGGAEILQVEQRSVKLRHHGEIITLTLPSEGSGS